MTLNTPPEWDDPQETYRTYSDFELQKMKESAFFSGVGIATLALLLISWALLKLPISGLPF